MPRACEGPPVLMQRLAEEIASYHAWRENLAKGINAYRDWLEQSGQLDIQQSARFFDLLESLKQDRLLLAFIAEFSRGKSELINTLFFSGYKQRLMPSDLGRTTMCPVEIFHDPSEPPYIRLLPIETYRQEGSISQLKKTPVEWSQIRLNLDSVSEIQSAFQALTEVKQAHVLEARMMGLLREEEGDTERAADEQMVDVPAWRYAMINFPHPLLTNGLTILDTPGLNSVGLEPELTLATLPNAHAVLFLLGIDTGVTRSDLEVWERFVKPNVGRRIAVLNKIDLAWDETKPWADIDAAIQRQREETARILDLPTQQVLALSAQKALLGKIRGDSELIEKSGILQLETMLADEIIPAKRQILAQSVTYELGTMMSASRHSIKSRVDANQAAMVELTELSGKGRELISRLWKQVSVEQREYSAALAEYKVVHALFADQRDQLISYLSQDKLDRIIDESFQVIQSSWTTVGLSDSMQRLVNRLSREFDGIQSRSDAARGLMEQAYASFQTKFRFDRFPLPVLDLQAHRRKLQLLLKETEVFCRDPVNVMTAKKFLVPKFYDGLVRQAQLIFANVRTTCQNWLKTAPIPLETQIRDHKDKLQQRMDNLFRMNENTDTVKQQLATLEQEIADLSGQQAMIERLYQELNLEMAVGK